MTAHSPLEQIEVTGRELDDPAMVCTRCGATLCSVEHGDTMATLLAVAFGHLREQHPAGT